MGQACVKKQADFLLASLFPNGVRVDEGVGPHDRWIGTLRCEQAARSYGIRVSQILLLEFPDYTVMQWYCSFAR